MSQGDDVVGPGPRKSELPQPGFPPVDPVLGNGVAKTAHPVSRDLLHVGPHLVPHAKVVALLNHAHKSQSRRCPGIGGVQHPLGPAGGIQRELNVAG